MLTSSDILCELSGQRWDTSRFWTGCTKTCLILATGRPYYVLLFRPGDIYTIPWAAERESLNIANTAATILSQLIFLSSSQAISSISLLIPFPTSFSFFQLVLLQEASPPLSDRFLLSFIVAKGLAHRSFLDVTVVIILYGTYKRQSSYLCNILKCSFLHFL